MTKHPALSLSSWIASYLDRYKQANPKKMPLLNGVCYPVRNNGLAPLMIFRHLHLKTSIFTLSVLSYQIHSHLKSEETTVKHQIYKNEKTNEFQIPSLFPVCFVIKL